MAYTNVEIAVKRNRPYLPYKKYKAILRDANHLMRDKIVYGAETAQLPYRLGDLYIRKFENQYNEDNKKNWAINFKATLEAGHTIYYGAEYGYRWKWNKKNAVVKGKKWYTFKPCRTASRVIADAIINKGLDFYRK
jgi:hypothetical protein